ncbi:hypothetical protein [Sinorhizobium medicae]|nr:hypothetical protein [Sinorhizobium medicae]MDX0512752.1 hypothetical protein [Sinorhizobium medicae]MDX0937368.1 hypothetical protein [Sinorhizobium medicae]MDX0949023.1 hypothetical protein [Sinorhizobium medicae]MDX1010712.1 hypothetical protein [Sinorhizobium medicae]MDX1013336.1 hypothetical protein [Sinorhizobium medicae]
MTLRTISIDELDHFKLDENGRLYWKGEAVILEKRLRLETYQIVLATLATAGAVLSGIHPFGATLGWW